MKSFAGSVGWLSLGSIVTRLLGAVSGIVSARALGVDGRGGLSVLLVVGMIAGGVLPLGLDLWAARSLGGGADVASVRRLLTRHLAGVSVLVVVGVAVTMIYSARTPALVVSVGLLCLSATALTLRLGVLQGLDEMKSYSMAALASTAVFALGLVLLTFINAASVTSFVLAAAAGQAVSALWPPRRVGRSASTAYDRLKYRTALRFGVPTAIGAVSALLLYRLDVLLLSWWSDLSNVGLYSVALAVTEVIWVVPTAAAQAIVPHASKQNPTLDTARLSRVVVLLMVVTSFCVMTLSPFVVPLVFGAAFSPAVNAIPFLSLAAVGVGIWKLIGHDLIARGNARARLLSGVAGIVVMVVFDAVLIPRYGVIGAAAGAAAAYLVAAWLVLLAWRPSSGARIRDALLVRRSDISDLRSRIGKRGREPQMKRSSAT